MKSFSDPAMAEILAGTAIVTGAVEILCDPPVRVWGGYGTLTFSIAGVPTSFKGIGDRGLAQVTAGALGDSEQNVTLTLSGVEPDVLALFDADEVRDAPAVLWRLIYKGDGKTLLDAQIFKRGRVDTLPVEHVIGGAAAINAMVETAARGLGRQGSRMRTDADQRLVDPTDGFYKNISFAAEKMLYWGGQRPAVAGQALPGARVTGGGESVVGGAKLRQVAYE